MVETQVQLSTEARNLFQQWFDEATFSQGDWNTGNRFELFYFALTTVGRDFSKETRDSQMLDWLKVHDSPVGDAFQHRLQSASFLQRLEQLKRLSPVKDSRNIAIERSIFDIRDMGQVLDVIYMIRCNYAHGNKPTNDRNARLFEAGAHILKEWLEVIYTRSVSGP